MGSDTPLLKDCPFCGEDDALGIGKLSNGLGFELYFIRCMCGGKGPEEYDSIAAITTWNTRSTQPDTDSGTVENHED